MNITHKSNRLRTIIKTSTIPTHLITKPIEVLYQFHSTNIIKRSLIRVNKVFTLLDRIETSTGYKYAKKSFFYSLFISSFFVLGYRIKGNIKAIRAEYNDAKITQILEYHITNSIIRFVFHNQDLTNNLVRIIEAFLGREKTTEFIVNQFIRLFKSKIMFDKTFDLTRDKLLLGYLFENEEIYYKFRGVLGRVLRNESIKDEAVHLVSNFARSDKGVELFKEKFIDGLENRDNQQKFSKEIKGFIFEKMSDEIYHKIANEKLIDMFK